MGTQSGGFSPINTQNGTNLKDDRFANMSDEAMSNDSFDPMNTQSGGFTPIDTQNGTNLKGDRFLNASGNFDPMNTQSGGFSPISTQSGANLKGDRFSSFLNLQIILKLTHHMTLALKEVEVGLVIH